MEKEADAPYDWDATDEFADGSKKDAA